MFIDYSLQEFWRVSRMVNILGPDVTSGYLKIKIFRSQSPKEKALLMQLEQRVGGTVRATVTASGTPARTASGAGETLRAVVVPLQRG